MVISRDVSVSNTGDGVFTRREPPPVKNLTHTFHPVINGGFFIAFRSTDANLRDTKPAREKQGA